MEPSHVQSSYWRSIVLAWRK